ncbi:50S ribosomal protein L19 [Candidatus Peregrinibacteria bacterium]|nr:50S ribosomal protein L19 [Candidatus Peregrinibacteria bacterium]
MTNLLIQDIEKSQVTKKLPELRPGTTVKVHQRIKEGNKERTQVFEGLIIKASHGAGSNKTITVRKIVEGIGVEKIFPIYAPSIEKIEIIRVGKVRQSKLYYMREISGKAARLKERVGEKKKLMEAINEEAKSKDEKAANENETVVVNNEQAAPKTATKPETENENTVNEAQEKQEEKMQEEKKPTEAKEAAKEKDDEDKKEPQTSMDL